jgi:hypothetical protein
MPTWYLRDRDLRLEGEDMPTWGLCPPPLPPPPEPRQDDRSFSVVDHGTYVYPVQYGSTRGTIRAAWGYGLFPWEFTATLTEEVDSSAIISADPTRTSYIAYPLAKCPTETWFMLYDSERVPLPAQFYLTIDERGPDLRAVWS